MSGLNLFASEHALVTGAASNIGRAIAIALAEEGATVTISDIDSDRLAAVASEISAGGGRVQTVVADLAAKDGWQRIMHETSAQTPAMFVHSACPKRHESDIALEVEEQTFDDMLTTNVRSGFLLGRDVAKQMKRDGIEGRLLYITSLHAHTPRNLPHYSASKAGMTMLMKELARQLGPSGIRVNALAPGAIPGGGFATSDDKFQPKKRIPLQRLGTAEDIAEAAMALLSNRFMKYVTGETLVVDGGLQLFNWIDMPED